MPAATSFLLSLLGCKYNVAITAITSSYKYHGNVNGRHCLFNRCQVPANPAIVILLLYTDITIKRPLWMYSLSGSEHSSIIQVSKLRLYRVFILPVFFLHGDKTWSPYKDSWGTWMRSISDMFIIYYEFLSSAPVSPVRSSNNVLSNHCLPASCIYLKFFGHTVQANPLMDYKRAFRACLNTFPNWPEASSSTSLWHMALHIQMPLCILGNGLEVELRFCVPLDTCPCSPVDKSLGRHVQ